MAVPDCIDAIVQKLKRPRQKNVVAVTVCVSFCAVSSWLSLKFIQDFSETKGLQMKADALRETLDCLTEASADREICNSKFGFNQESDDNLFLKECANEEGMNNFTKEVEIYFPIFSL